MLIPYALQGLKEFTIIHEQKEEKPFLQTSTHLDKMFLFSFIFLWESRWPFPSTTNAFGGTSRVWIYVRCIGRHVSYLWTIKYVWPACSFCHLRTRNVSRLMGSWLKWCGIHKGPSFKNKYLDRNVLVCFQLSTLIPYSSWSL